MLRPMTNRTSWKRLGAIAKQRRERLGLTQEEVAGAGGPSTATLRNIESALADSYRAKTLYALDEALGWTRGTAVGIAEGEAPWFSLMTFDDFLKSAVRDVSSQVARGEDFPVVGPTSDAARPVGLGLDEEAGGLPEDDVDDIRAMIRAKRARRGLA